MDPSSAVSLRTITAATVRQVTALTVAPEQARFVAPNAVSLAEALFAPEAWYRAIYAGEEPAGFVMLYDEALRPDPPPSPRLGLWRFMVDQRFQGRGVGRQALELVIRHLEAAGAPRLLELSHVPGPGGPQGFYRKLGFADTDRVDDGEQVMEMQLPRQPGAAVAAAAPAAGQRQGQGRFAIAAYRPRPGRQADLLELLDRHRRLLVELGLVGTRARSLMQAADGSIVEVFEWASAEAVAAAHRHPAVLALWQSLEAVCTFEPLAALPEAARPFADFMSLPA